MLSRNYLKSEKTVLLEKPFRIYIRLQAAFSALNAALSIGGDSYPVR